MERAQIVEAVQEINKVLGLDPQIDPGLGTDELKGKLKEAVELVSDDDEFSDDTQQVLAYVKQPNSDGADAPKRRGGAKPGQSVPRREGSMAEFTDNLLLAGTTWKELEETVIPEAAKRGTSNFSTMSKIKAHIKFRGNSKKYEVVSDDTNVKMTEVVVAA